ncbi:MAG TPA: aromatic amino acid lyase, partial [Oceanobacillus sp.]|nr:aromatic amino acid lyase [Oceanobacillus sp.]
VEDHVSMGCTAALKARRIINNVERILSIELMSAAQGIDFRKEVTPPGARLGRGTQPVYDLIRQHVPFIAEDTIMYHYMDAVHKLVREHHIVNASASGY